MTIAPLACVILAGGKGTRMKSSLPKLLHQACGRTLLDWTLGAVAEFDPQRVVVVVPPDDPELVAEPARLGSRRGPAGGARDRRRGVLCGRPALEGFEGVVVVLNADHPLTDPQSLRDLVAAHTEADARASVIALRRTDEIGAAFGRIVRGPDGEFERIVEVRDATAEQRAITEVSTGIFAFHSASLWPALDRLDSDNAQGELYLTDVIEILRGDGDRVIAHTHADPTIAVGVNHRADLAEAARLLRARINHRHMLAGVTLIDPASTMIDDSVQIEADVTIHPFTVLRGDTRIATGAEVGPHVVAVDAIIGESALVGPFCYLRPGAELAAPGQGRNLCGDQELPYRRGREGAASVLHRRCRDRRRHEHRRRWDHRQLRRREQAADGYRRGRPHQLRQCLRCAGDHWRPCVDCGRIGYHRRRSTRRPGGCACPSKEHRGIWKAKASLVSRRRFRCSPRVAWRPAR